MRAMKKEGKLTRNGIWREEGGEGWRGGLREGCDASCCRIQGYGEL